MVYLDYNNATPVDQHVLDSMIPVFTKQFGNPMSSNNAGNQAKQLVEDARIPIARSVCMDPHDVIFHPNRDAANKFAIIGTGVRRPNHPRIVFGVTEHRSVIEVCLMLGGGNPNACIPAMVNSLGFVDTDNFEKLLSGGEYALASLSLANGVTGIINPVKKLAKIAHDHGMLVHCDASQALGKLPFSAKELGVDMVTVDSGLIYGPRGCAALVANSEARRFIQKAFPGRGDKVDMDSHDSILNVPGIVGFGRACEVAIRDSLADMPRQQKLRNRFENMMLENIEGLMIFGLDSDRLPNTSCMAIDGVAAKDLAVDIPELDFSHENTQPATQFDMVHTITCMGYMPKTAMETFTVSFGRQTSDDDIDEMLDRLVIGAMCARSNPENKL